MKGKDCKMFGPTPLIPIAIAIVVGILIIPLILKLLWWSLIIVPFALGVWFIIQWLKNRRSIK